MALRGAYKGSKSGIKGIYFDRFRKKQWRAMCRIGRKQFTIGYFFTVQDAAIAKKDFEKKIENNDRK